MSTRPLDVFKTKTKAYELFGRVVSVRNNLILISIPEASIGELIAIESKSDRPLLGEVVGFESNYNKGSLQLIAQVAPLSNIYGVSANSIVQRVATSLTVKCPISSQSLIVVDGLGNPLEGPIQSDMNLPSLTLQADRSPPLPLTRAPIKDVLVTGVRSIDTLFTVGVGQRICISAPPGVGKSTLLSTLARNIKVDRVVVALVGERGREVREFIDHALSEVKSSTYVVVATSDEPPALRRLAPLTATAIAEYYRDQGENVLLLIDSLTRMARAERELGLQRGEPIVRGGLTPSVFTALPKLLERAGPGDKVNKQGSISAFYTLLADEEESLDALTAESKSLLDGHLTLSRDLSTRGIRPSISPLKSISRLRSSILTEEEIKLGDRFMQFWSKLEENRELPSLGVTPSPEVATLLKREGEFTTFLSQDISANERVNESWDRLRELLKCV
jgi:flagellum-specific ATP synthase